MGTRGGGALRGRSPPRLCERRGKKCGSGWGDGFCSSHRVFHQRGGFVPQAASAESIKAAEGGSHPTLCIYETAPARYLPGAQKHPRKVASVAKP